VYYTVEREQGIARARNNAVRHATGNYIAFIDDDEFAPTDWLLSLYGALERFGVDGVLGPVDPYFEPNAPRWIVEGGFYRRSAVATGTVLEFRQCRTGNVLLKRETLSGDEPFDAKCLSGEDQDFFRRKISAGGRFVWCLEAGVHEHVPPGRWKRSFLIRRALFRGVFAQRNHGLQPLRVLQSLIAVPVYIIVLPIALLMGQARFMLCVFKLSYFTGRLLALVGFNPIRGAYVVD
jgi:glycosyltransferase involved in cell wall biosynthesis